MPNSTSTLAAMSLSIGVCDLVAEEDVNLTVFSGQNSGDKGQMPLADYCKGMLNSSHHEAYTNSNSDSNIDVCNLAS